MSIALTSDKCPFKGWGQFRAFNNDHILASRSSIATTLPGRLQLKVVGENDAAVRHDVEEHFLYQLNAVLWTDHLVRLAAQWPASSSD